MPFYIGKDRSSAIKTPSLRRLNDLPMEVLLWFDTLESRYESKRWDYYHESGRLGLSLH